MSTFPRKKGKYGARKTACNNCPKKHDSKKEAWRCDQLHILQRANQIFGLSTQVPYEYTDGDASFKYIADFTYTLPSGAFRVEDVKGFRTEVYKLKKKLIEARFGFEIHEV